MSRWVEHTTVVRLQFSASDIEVSMGDGSAKTYDERTPSASGRCTGGEHGELNAQRRMLRHSQKLGRTS